MRIAFYAPFKPLSHPNPSGDLTIAKGIVQFLESRGHRVDVVSRLRTRWIYFRIWNWPRLVYDFLSILIRLKQNPPDLWLTYHTYYKAPDVLGPFICRLLGIRYVIFQGIYSTKKRRKIKTILGFFLNRAALKRADHVFTNKSVDYANLKRIIPGDRLTYIRPGLRPFGSQTTQKEMDDTRNSWNAGNRVVILSAAMFRDDVKTKGLIWLIECCAKLLEHTRDFILVIAGSGVMEDRIKSTAQARITDRWPGHVVFTGKIPQDQMARFYRSGDLFAFPGIGEALGMVFLEAQSCGLPVVAFDNCGVPEAVADTKTGFLTPMYDCDAFSSKLLNLIADPALRRTMGRQASGYVQAEHDLDANYLKFEELLERNCAT
ncbi:MAG: glycosyltransferase family 1 protein [Desulfobacteraceae bacterium]|nr:MAG: glycosyltransferase family 1 protein [Desulfobacteraceae bacterium]